MGITMTSLSGPGEHEGPLALSMEDTNTWMSRLGRHELTGVQHLSLDETVAAIETVTLDDVHAVAKEVFSGPFVIGAVGPFDASDLEQFVA
jgi:predicted Zn-dependent peptidase